MPDEAEQDALSKIKAYFDAGHSFDAIRQAGWASWFDHLEAKGYDLRTGLLNLESPNVLPPAPVKSAVLQSSDLGNSAEYESGDDYEDDYEYDDGAAIDQMDREISKRSRRGWQLTSQARTSAQMRKPTRFSLAAALLWTLFFGIGLIIYLFWHAAKKEETVYMHVVDGRLEIEESNLLSAVIRPFQLWLRWASERGESYLKILAYGIPIGGVLMIISLLAQSVNMSIFSGAVILIVAVLAASSYWLDRRESQSR